MSRMPTSLFKTWGRRILRPAATTICVGVIGGLLSAQTPLPAGVTRSEFIYESAPFPSCHASTIVETSTGLVAAWFGGTAERNPDVGIWTSRFEGGRWTTPVEVANGFQSPSLRYPTWNPVLFQPAGGPLLLFYKVGPSPSEWWGMSMRSRDEGKTWDSPVRLPDGVLGPVKNKPIALSDGTILSGSSTEHNGWQVHFERSSDQGRTWTVTGPLNDGKTLAAIQPSLLTYRDGRLQALGRTRSGKIFETWSSDSGHTWTPITLTELPNPSAGTDAVTLRDGRQLVVYNHTAMGRSPLNVAVSEDGRTWQAALVLEDAGGLEFSYPAVIQTRDGRIHVTYTFDRRMIKHVVLDPARL